MIKTLKIMLIPNNKQKSKLFQSAGVARFAYNLALGREQENYKNGGNFLSDYDLRKEFTKLKSTEEYKWINDYSNNITKQAIKDACLAYKRFFKGQSAFPKFKSRRKSKPSFYMDTDKIQFTDKTVKLEKITLSRKKNKQKLNWIRLAERNKIPIDGKYINPRITFDGINWWISVGIQYADNAEPPVNDGVGIDLGIKDLAICSDIDKPYKNINKTQKIRKLKKKKRRLQRQISKKYLISKKGDSYCKTSNIIKAEKKLLKLNHRLTDIRHDYLHQTTTEIINRKPKFIVLEDLNVKGMMKNKHLSEAVAEQCFYEFYRQIEYKSSWNNIKFIIVDRFYASSKICSCCGAVKKDLKLSDRIYKCDNCNTVIDRDKNASINLYNYGKSIA
ncbi:transposase [Clostridium neonatale]|uniref:Transposase n=2 Tax=Clostridium neonatale TaxID=137838 RepID=A0AAD2DFU7_9CLOT|nr:transposase [Clostridium neonatale]CAI3203840.1 transposase [Clostridium neonatale]CAI3204505.1 transposase [Clostridium neonatale]CAI3206447.1 transposase [Clostridium neonatale]CAI3240780.1 transposase [Clostridium neonatale]CAI3245799.1 transposase [Clostridium neonatale]